MEHYAKSIGRQILKARRHRRLTQGQLCKRLHAHNYHIDDSYISKIERGGKYPSTKLLYCILEELECRLQLVPKECRARIVLRKPKKT